MSDSKIFAKFLHVSIIKNKEVEQLMEALCTLVGLPAGGLRC